MAEDRDISCTYEFYDECLREYGGPNVFKALTDLFEYLPLAAVVENAVRRLF